jgi:hypothetical protein
MAGTLAGTGLGWGARMAIFCSTLNTGGATTAGMTDSGGFAAGVRTETFCSTVSTGGAAAGFAAGGGVNAAAGFMTGGGGTIAAAGFAAGGATALQIGDDTQVLAVRCGGQCAGIGVSHYLENCIGLVFAGERPDPQPVAGTPVL